MKFLSLQHLGIVLVTALLPILQHDMRTIDVIILYGVLLANVRILDMEIKRDRETK
jgi:hypothetical protein